MVSSPALVTAGRFGVDSSHCPHAIFYFFVHNHNRVEALQSALLSSGSLFADGETGRGSLVTRGSYQVQLLIKVLGDGGLLKLTVRSRQVSASAKDRAAGGRLRPVVIANAFRVFGT